MDFSDLTLRDKLDAIEACEKLIEYYKEELKKVNLRPVRMGNDPFDVDIDDQNIYDIEDRISFTQKIKELEASKERLTSSLEDDYTFKIATGRRQHPFNR